VRACRRASAPRPSPRRLDPPEARALVLDQGGLRVALVSLDVVIVRPGLRDELVDAGRELGIDAVVVVATHTHSGPGGYMRGWLAERVTAGGFVEEMEGLLARAGARALERAVSDLAPAGAASATGELELARNRRWEDGRDEVALNLIRLDFRRGRDPIVAFAYGAHPTVLSPRSRVYSADYVGPARAWLEERGWRPLFLPGPLGDQEPAPRSGELWPEDLDEQRAQASEIGTRLGEAVAALADSVSPRSDATLAALERWVEPPPARIRRFCALWWVSPLVGGTLEDFLSDRVPMHAIRIGRAEIITLPGEPSSAVGEEIRRRIPPNVVPILVAHANDWVGYVVSPATYKRGGYEACLSFHGPGLGPWMVEEAAETVRLLQAREVAGRGTVLAVEASP
jgi:hypothetical protein